MFIPDGSGFDYDTHVPPPPWMKGAEQSEWLNEHSHERRWVIGRYSWGWLGDSVPPGFRGGWNPEEKDRVLELLRERTKDSVILLHCGSHECAICEKDGHREDMAWRWNGSFIVTHGEISFRAPAAVGHYIEKHDYNPGGFVINALMNGCWASAADEQAQIEERHRQMRVAAEKERTRKAEEQRTWWESLSSTEQANILAARAEREKQIAAWQAKIEHLRNSGAMVE